jgi:hypothetical protein
MNISRRLCLQKFIKPANRHLSIPRQTTDILLSKKFPKPDIEYGCNKSLCPSKLVSKSFATNILTHKPMPFPPPSPYHSNQLSVRNADSDSDMNRSITTLKEKILPNHHLQPIIGGHYIGVTPIPSMSAIYKHKIRRKRSVTRYRASIKENTNEMLIVNSKNAEKLKNFVTVRFQRDYNIRVKNSRNSSVSSNVSHTKSRVGSVTGNPGGKLIGTPVKMRPLRSSFQKGNKTVILQYADKMGTIEEEGEAVSTYNMYERFHVSKDESLLLYPTLKEKHNYRLIWREPLYIKELVMEI